MLRRNDEVMDGRRANPAFGIAGHAPRRALGATWAVDACRRGRGGNLIVAVVPIGCGMIPLVAPNLFRAAPGMLRTLLDSGIPLATIASVALSAFLKAAPAGAGAACVASGHV